MLEQGMIDAAPKGRPCRRCNHAVGFTFREIGRGLAPMTAFGASMAVVILLAAVYFLLLL